MSAGRAIGLGLQLALLCTALGVYIGINLVGARFADNAPLWRFYLPNIWLIVISLSWIKIVTIQWRVAGGGKRTRLGVAVSALFMGFVLLLALFWPLRIGPSLGYNDFLLVWLVPVAEELFFRGILLDLAQKCFDNKTVTVLLTSVLFGLGHLPQGMTVFGVMVVLSVILAAVTLATSSLLWPTAIHVGWNALSVMRVMGSMTERWTIAAAALAAMTALAVWGIISSRHPREPKPGPLTS
jgi:membrane protease YdiL (CAAX protease family)